MLLVLLTLTGGFSPPSDEGPDMMARLNEGRLDLIDEKFTYIFLKLHDKLLFIRSRPDLIFSGGERGRT